MTIVTYGGSGHEPAQAGFVGKGMLDIQAVVIFSPPPTASWCLMP
ncbi:MAG: dihydroxyacetone kinase subunit DhaK [Dysosmobacter welbionis]